MEKEVKNRPLRFRAWNKKEKKWLDPEELIIFGDGTFGEVDKTCWDGGVTTLQEYWDNIIVTQFTGLLDKDEKEIYERDILNSLYRSDGCKGLYEIVWDGMGFRPIRHLKHQQIYVTITANDLTRCKIIGNTCENPELLK